VEEPEDEEPELEPVEVEPELEEPEEEEESELPAAGVELAADWPPALAVTVTVSSALGVWTLGESVS
jgi:hypothetical protein